MDPTLPLSPAVLGPAPELRRGRARLFRLGARHGRPAREPRKGEAHC
jgi:hypothetical protein